MSKYLQSYEIHKEVIQEKTKQRVMRIAVRIVRVMNVKKVSNELSGPFAKVGALESDNDSSSPSENVHKNCFD